MSRIELQMMTSLRMQDDRNEASVPISFTNMQLIQGCFELLQSHLSAKKYEKGLTDVNDADLECVKLQKIDSKKLKMSSESGS
jgi:hypothetical protein